MERERVIIVCELKFIASNLTLMILMADGIAIFIELTFQNQQG